MLCINTWYNVWESNIENAKSMFLLIVFFFCHVLSAQIFHHNLLQYNDVKYFFLYALFCEQALWNSKPNMDNQVAIRSFALFCITARLLDSVIFLGDTLYYIWLNKIYKNPKSRYFVTFDSDLMHQLSNLTQKFS